MKRHFRSRFSCLARLFQLGSGLAFFVGLLPDATIARNFQLEPIGKRVYYGDADTVQAARNLIGVAVEFSARVQYGEDDLGSGTLLGGMHIDRYAATIVDDRNRIVSVHSDIDFVRVAAHSFVDRVVNDFPDEMVQSH